MIIDMDAHILPQDAYAYIDSAFDHQKPVLHFDHEGRLASWNFPGWHQVPGTTPFPPPGPGGWYKGLTDLETRMADYRKLGIECQLLLPQFTALMFNYTLEAGLARAMAHSYNLSLLNVMKAHPDQLLGAALVALQDVAGAISELEWAVRNGFRAVTIDKVFPVRTHPYSETIAGQRGLWPFFKRAEALGVPVILHQINHGHRISNLPIFQQDGLSIGTVSENRMSLMAFCTSGLLDHCPGLQVVYTEGGTAFITPLIRHFETHLSKPFTGYEDEMTAAWARGTIVSGKPLDSVGMRMTTAETYKPKNAKPIAHYFHHNFLFTIETEEPGFAEAVHELGADRFLFATDYPHDDPGGRMKWKDVELLRDNPDISEADKAMIRSENALRVLAPGSSGNDQTPAAAAGASRLPSVTPM